jgi:hypothetical protein
MKPVCLKGLFASNLNALNATEEQYYETSHAFNNSNGYLRLEPEYDDGPN